MKKILIFSDDLIEHIFSDASIQLDNVTLFRDDLKKEISFFESTMKQVQQHPWSNLTIKKVKRDTNSALYKGIQQKFVGPDPEEDYKQVIVWKIADLLYVTAAVDHDPSYTVKWDVVVFDENKQVV